jgi:hypothetical protein
MLMPMFKKELMRSQISLRTILLLMISIERLQLIQIQERLLDLFSSQIHILTFSINKEHLQTVAILSAAETMDQTHLSNQNLHLQANGEIITATFLTRP